MALSLTRVVANTVISSSTENTNQAAIEAAVNTIDGTYFVGGEITDAAHGNRGATSTTMHHSMQIFDPDPEGYWVSDKLNEILTEIGESIGAGISGGGAQKFYGRDYSLGVSATVGPITSGIATNTILVSCDHQMTCSPGNNTYTSLTLNGDALASASNLNYQFIASILSPAATEISTYPLNCVINISTVPSFSPDDTQYTIGVYAWGNAGAGTDWARLGVSVV